ncbi:MAG: SusC/RagA family TonB-linked outer membrane protein [Gemmatimonadales bacterium]
MVLFVRRVLAAAACVIVLPARAPAQEPVTITGRVTSDAGGPLGLVEVSIPSIGVGGFSNEDGRYSILVPGARVAAQPVILTARRLGFKAASVQISLAAGGATQDFVLAANPLQLGEIVVTGAGTVTEVEKLGSVRNAVSADLIERSNEQNIVEALAGKAPNVEVTASSGEPGASAYIRIRGLRTIQGSTQPLLVVDGLPIDNSSFSTSNFNPLDELGTGEISGTTQNNRAVDLNPADIESVEILKGAAAAAIYGARAGQGVVLITTKRGRPGRTRYSLRSSLSVDDLTRTYPLQRRYGLGRFGASPLPCDDIAKATCLRSWGPDLSVTGAASYDHANEAYTTGWESDNNLAISGGNDRTTFYLSGAYLNHRGVFVGPNNEFQRSTLRLNASHRVTDALKLDANMSYADTRGQFVLRGNNVNGLQLGLLRSPPDFNNRPHLDPATGFHRSYRLQNPGPTDCCGSRGFDNPFFALLENVNTSAVGRVFGNVSAEYLATSWLRLNYTLGADYSNDERLEGAPQASSDVSAGGRITEGKITNYQIDHNFTTTAAYRASNDVSGTVTVGQNLNTRNLRQLSVVGRTLIAPTPFKLSNTVSRDPPIDNETVIHGISYFGQATVDLFGQLYLTLAARNDGSSTFGEANRRNWFPKASAAWTFTKAIGPRAVLSFGKVRASYGEAGQEPDPYLGSTVFSSALLSGIAQGTGLNPSQGGFGGLATGVVKGADNLRPERSREFEAGFDLGLFNDKADLGFTFYNSITDDVILLTPLAPSTGFFVQAQNAAKFRNRGQEVTLNVRPVTRGAFSWDVGLQWARNRSKVLELPGADFVTLDGVSTITPYQVAKQGEEVGVFYDFGVVRCGVSDPGTVPGLATACAGAPTGAMYIAADGFPVADPNLRVVGNPNPRWTGSVRTSLTFRRIQLSGLLDVKHGGQIYNGTRGALYSYGTHKDTEQRAICDGTTCTGNERVFGQGGWFDGPVVGPGAGQAVPIGENWYRLGLGPCPFSNVSELCMEDGGFVKLREISVGYTFDQPWVQRTLGLASLTLRAAGRNLHTWTKYTGYDPETNLGGAIQKTRGMDYFVMPQTRSFVFTVSMNY